MLRVQTLVIAAALCAGCAPTGSPSLGTSDGPRGVMREGGDGKADDYVSTNAREYELLGHAHVELPDGFADLGDEERQSRLQELVDRRMSVVGRSVRRTIDEVLRAENGDERGEDARYFTYFKREHAETDAPEVLEDGRWARFGFRMQLVGSVWLMSKLAPDDSSPRTFTVEVGDGDGAETEPVTVEIRGSDSRDAFPEYDQLFADGVYDMAVHFGGDYNAERYDIETARWFFEYMQEGGWQTEVASFDELRIDSPPFRRELRIEGRAVEARIHIYHADMVDAADEEQLAEVMRTSFAERDVVVYSGHAGEGAGFILDYEPRFEISASDFATLPMRDEYQIFVFDGCRTYRSYVDDMMANPAKTFDNVDIVTTVNTTPFSAGYQMLHQLIYWLTITNDDGQHFPISWMGLLRGLNTESFRSVHYGVHGIDDNPQLNPNGSEGVACRPCASDADCGAGGNFCLDIESTGQGRCGVACTTDTACGRGARCARLFDIDDQFYLPKQCIPRDYTCG